MMKIEEKDGDLVITDFDNLEACKIACKIESDGIHFYTQLAGRAGDLKVRRALELLAFQERDHLEYFERELTRLRVEREDSFEEDDLLTSFNYGVFQPYESMEGLEKALDSPLKALRLGIVVEEKAIKFYEYCKARVTSPRTKEELAKIIEEEKEHKRAIEDAFEATSWLRPRR